MSATLFELDRRAGPARPSADLIPSIKEVSESVSGYPLLPHHEAWVRDTFAPRVKYSCLSMARGGAKTYLASQVIYQVISPDGALHAPDRQVLVASPTINQSKTLMTDLYRCLGWRVGDPHPRGYKISLDQHYVAILHKASGAEVRVVAAGNLESLHGLRPWLVVVDECSELPRPQSVFDILSTGLGKVPDSRAVLLGVAPAHLDGHFFGRLLQAAEDPRQSEIVGQWHRAPKGANVLDETAWLAANPGLPWDCPIESVLRFQAEQASRDPIAATSFRMLRLNQGLVGDARKDVLVDPAAWAVACERTAEPDGQPVVGIDLGGNKSLTVAVAVWPAGAVDYVALMGAEPGIADRANKDGIDPADYHTAIAQGRLRVEPGQVPSLEVLLSLIDDRWGKPVAIIADHHRRGELEDRCHERGWRSLLETRQTGYGPMSPDLASFSQLVLDGPLAPPQCPLLASHVAATLVITGDTGHQRPKKFGDRNNDLAMALIFAAGGLARRQSKPKARVVFSTGRRGFTYSS